LAVRELYFRSQIVLRSAAVHQCRFTDKLEAAEVSISMDGRGRRLDNVFARPRSVALARYFDRYFSYTVDPEDISDAELTEFRELCEGGEDEKSTDLLTSLVKRNAPVLIARLRAMAGQQSRDLTERMVRILVKNGQLFVPIGTGLNDGLSAQSAMLVAELILNCPGDSEQLASVARQTVDQAEPLTFALRIYQELTGTEFKNRTMLGKSDALLAETAIVDLRTALVNRISQAALQRPIYEELLQVTL